MEPKPDTIEIPGGRLYYELRGAGPVLICIPGGPADAGDFASLANALADRYTVVAYDPPGNSRSVLDEPPDRPRVPDHADAAARLIDTIGGGPANILGSSGGALVGFDLAARHPDRVRTLVAHEPPTMELLDEAKWRAFGEDVRDTYEAEGVFPAIMKFGMGIGLEAPPPPENPTPEMMEGMARLQGNLEYFVGHIIPYFSRFRPDFATLRNGSPRVVIAGGEEGKSKPHPAYEATLLCAEKLGTQVVHFPGSHGGFSSHTDAFAERLHEVLGERSS